MNIDERALLIVLAKIFAEKLRPIDGFDALLARVEATQKEELARFRELARDFTPEMVEAFKQFFGDPEKS